MQSPSRSNDRRHVEVVGFLGVGGEEGSQLSLHSPHDGVFVLDVDEETGSALRHLRQIVVVEGQLWWDASGRRTIVPDAVYVVA